MTSPVSYVVAASAVDVPTPSRAGARQDPAEMPRSAPAAAASAPQPKAPSPGLQAFDLRFRVDPDLQEVVVTMVDPQSGDVLRQIPSEDALKLAKALESIANPFFQDHA
jgi:flagellar protein FlaG